MLRQDLKCRLCIGDRLFHSCITERGERTNCCPNLYAERVIPARKTVGMIPSAMFLDDDEVVALTVSSNSVRRILLREGGWELSLPSRSTVLKRGFTALFTLMRHPAVGIVRGEILEFEPVESIAYVESVLRYVYGEKLSFIAVGDNSRMDGEGYSIRVDDRKRVLFEVKRGD